MLKIYIISKNKYKESILIKENKKINSNGLFKVRIRQKILRDSHSIIRVVYCSPNRCTFNN